MRNAENRENERDDKFLRSHRIDEAPRVDPGRGPGFTTRVPRLVNYAELFTDLSPSPLLLYFRETKSDGKYRERVRRKGKKKIHRRFKKEESKFRREKYVLRVRGFCSMMLFISF